MVEQPNYFSLFELSMTLPVDTAELNRHYQQLQRQYHPDNYATVSDSDKAKVMQKSATINAAYRILKDPISAAQYRVSLEGIDIDSDHHTIRDPDFLGEQFELRERLDDIENTGDEVALQQFYNEVMVRKQQVYQTLLLAIEQHDWLMAKVGVYKLHYFARLIEQIELLQEKQFDL
ncbi:co-chaperone protein HscB [Orbus hercynius]|uniref:Co-chaperone protein HscB homolog n=1 Tax=Orbus hercynius TaxID=593135 RepID=A0A495RBG8_9GAMM|nr:Fe-S protein assembly co-chaperone HscB [Orbus hercynius]RKS84524.1 co-chaperone protein HscB [Orbus hercynius]